MEKKDLCCQQTGVSCARRGDPLFDCATGFDRWRIVWQLGKQAWCCEHEGKGCSANTAPMVSMDCADGFDNWKADWPVFKKAWCCDHEGKGCPGT